MSGITLRAKFNDKEAKSMLKELARRGDNARPALLEIGEYLTESTEQRFADQVDPDGNSWKALSPKYASKKKRNADLILVLNTYLGSTIAKNATNTSVEVGSNLERNIPARPFIGISTADETEIIEILKGYLRP